MTVNKQGESIEDIEEDIEDIQEDVEDLSEDVEDINDDMDKIHTHHKENSEGRLQHMVKKGLTELRNKHIL